MKCVLDLIGSFIHGDFLYFLHFNKWQWFFPWFIRVFFRFWELLFPFLIVFLQITLPFNKERSILIFVTKLCIYILLMSIINRFIHQFYRSHYRQVFNYGDTMNSLDTTMISLNFPATWTITQWLRWPNFRCKYRWTEALFNIIAFITFSLYF